MKNLVFLLFLLGFYCPAQAHTGGHGAPTKVWTFVNAEKPIQANFIEKIGERVYLSDHNQELLTFNYSDFNEAEQAYISERIHWIDSKNASPERHSFFHMKGLDWLMIVGAGLILFAFFHFKKKTRFLSYGLPGVVLIIMGCKVPQSIISDRVAANDISFMESLFNVFENVSTRHDNQYFYIESDGIPNHEMMTGITNWQQQVPINHDYSGSNAWAIPLQPVLASSPLSTKENFMKGAIAVAVNGIPIFNPLNNRGEDANAIGELDHWGGHCGRADDYHYHLPPSHLQEKVGMGKPIAYALDGFPVYGETTEQLDQNLGRFTSDSTYQYHAIKEYPYLIAAMRGEVKINPNTQAPENEIMPQAKTSGVRPDLSPLRDAKIVGFKITGLQQYSLNYEIESQVYSVNYGWDDSGNYRYEFVSPDGSVQVSTYKRN